MTRPEPDWKTIEIFIREHPDGGDFQAIADVFGCSHQRIQQLLARAIRKINHHLSERRVWDMTDVI